MGREVTDPFIRVSQFNEHRRETEARVHSVIKIVTDLRLEWTEFKGGLKSVKWLLSLILGGVGAEIAGHLLGWFK